MAPSSPGDSHVRRRDAAAGPFGSRPVRAASRWYVGQAAPPGCAPEVEGAVVVVVDFGFAVPPPDEQAAPTSAMRTSPAKARRALTRPKVSPVPCMPGARPGRGVRVDWAGMGSSGRI